MEEKIFTGKSVFANFLWRFFERTGAQLVQVIVSIVLARLLAPTEYGTVALMNVIINILAVFVNCNLGTALIQKKNSDNLDFSTVFYTQMTLSVIMYIILFLLAPFISKFYENPEMTSMLRVAGLSMIISGVKNVQNAYVSKNMLFKRFFFATLGGTIGAAFVGIGIAYAGLGAWAIIGQDLFNNTVDTIILWATVKWRPKKMFSFKRLKGLFSFGWKMMLSGLIDTLYNNLRAVIIGKVYTAADLAQYDKGKNWPSVIITNVNSSIDSVLLPSMASVQDSKDSLKGMTRRAMKTSAYVIAPLLMGLAACGKSVINILLTDKWMPSYPFMVIFCITYMFYPVHTANLNAIKAMGRSDLFLKLEIAKKIVGLAAILVTFKISVMAMAYSLLVVSVLSQIINSWPNKKLMNYSYLEQLKDILPGIGLAAFMGVCVYCVNFLHLSNWLTLLIQVPLGAVIYIGLSALLKLDSFIYVFNIIKPIFNKLFRKKEI